MAGKSFGKVLLPVDGSEHSKRAMDWAAALSAEGKGSIILLYVRPKISELLGEPFYQRALDQQLDEAKHILDPFEELLKESQAVFETIILEGDPAKAIVKCAEVERCDLVVMGGRGLGDLAGLVLGSVTHKVLHSSKVPVLIVP
ncbi:MAG: universal stress protein [Deltaproteobacteria bacterium]|mgnify:CR=1 FL=1|nr:MAG: universal stress protein [Deltaproteobacteria bacterium]